MYQVKLKGSYYEMGVQIGKLLKERKLYPDFDWYSPGSLPEKRMAFADKCEKLVQKHMPNVLDHLRGIADASGYDYSVARLWPICLNACYRPPLPSCSVVAIAGEYTASGRPMFVHNYDYLAEDLEGFTAFWTSPQDSIANLGFSDIYGGRYGGINEKGLAIATSISPYYNGSIQPGIAFSLSTRWILDQFATMKEAVNFLEKIPHLDSFNFLVCDIENNIARVEACPEKVEVIYCDEGIGISTNHYQSTAMKKLEKETGWRGSTDSRYSSALKWFHNRKEPITTDYVIKLAKKHKDGLCDHFESGDGGTIWSWIYTLGEEELLVSRGPPCQNEYQPIKIDFGFRRL